MLSYNVNNLNIECYFVLKEFKKLLPKNHVDIMICYEVLFKLYLQRGYILNTYIIIIIIYIHYHLQYKICLHIC